MSVTLKGKRNLDANDYERMVIRKKDKDYQVVIKSKTAYPKLENGYKISEELKDKTDNEKLQILVEYFLRYSKISHIEDGEIFPYYDGRFSTIRGTRQLDLQIGKENKGIIPKLVLEKYKNDRLQFIYDMKSISNYEISVNNTHTSYGLQERGFEPFVRIDLIAKDGKMYKMEREFLKTFINDILENSNDIALVEREKVFSPRCMTYVERDTYFTCGDVKVKLLPNSDMICEVKNMVNKHNFEINEAKSKQLKMEGF